MLTRQTVTEFTCKYFHGMKLSNFTERRSISPNIFSASTYFSKMRTIRKNCRNVLQFWKRVIVKKPYLTRRMLLTKAYSFARFQNAADEFIFARFCIPSLLKRSFLWHGNNIPLTFHMGASQRRFLTSSETSGKLNRVSDIRTNHKWLLKLPQVPENTAKRRAHGFGKER